MLHCIPSITGSILDRPKEMNNDKAQKVPERSMVGMLNFIVEMNNYTGGSQKLHNCITVLLVADNIFK